MSKSSAAVKETEAKAAKILQEQIDKLTYISSLTKEEAKNLLLQNLENSLQGDLARKIKE